MSRIGNKPIPVPSGVKVDIQGARVVVTGPKGKLEREIRPEVSIKAEEGNLVFETVDESKNSMAMKGLVRSLVNNMVVGVGTGFQKKLIVEGVGYRVAVEGKSLSRLSLICRMVFRQPWWTRPTLSCLNPLTRNSWG